MGYACYYVSSQSRDCGYGVPAYCDHPGCNQKIDRGLGHLCGRDPGGDEFGCGLYFCGDHLFYRQPRGEDYLVQNCPRCLNYKPPYKRIKPEHPEWMRWKLKDSSWAQWRKENPEMVDKYKKCLTK